MEANIFAFNKNTNINEGVKEINDDSKNNAAGSIGDNTDG